MWGKILGQALASLFKPKSPVQQPAVQQPAVQQPAVQQPAVQQPAVQQPAVQQPATAPVATTNKKYISPAKTRELAKQRYGTINTTNGKLAWENEAQWMAMFKVPPGFEHWINTASRRPTTQIYCNKDMHAPLQQALQNLLDRGLATELKTFDGCFQLRMVRGTTDSVSTHSYALAIDVNAVENGLGQEPKLSKEFVQAFKDAGFDWGGAFKRKDGMHFSFAWESK